MLARCIARCSRYCWLRCLPLGWRGSIPQWVDWTMVMFAAVIALRAHRGGFTVHRRCLPTAVAVTGLLMIVTTICLFKGNANHHFIQASGAMVVASSHFLNRHLCRSCVA